MALWDYLNDKIYFKKLLNYNIYIFCIFISIFEANISINCYLQIKINIYELLSIYLII